MVQAPKCKVCGASHFGGAHVWSNVGSGQAVPVTKAELRQIVRAPVVDQRDARIAELEAEVASLRAKLQPAKTADRAAYMREYRANKKAPSQ